MGGIARFIGRMLGVGGGGGLGGTVKEIAGAFRPNAEAQDKRLSDELVALYGAYGKEFHPPKNIFDSLVNGLNRLIRPGIVAGIGWLMYLSVADPAHFQLVMTGWATIPEFMGYAIGAVVSFYFGFRPFEKRMALKVDLDRVKAGGRAVMEMREAIRRERTAEAASFSPSVSPTTPQVRENDVEEHDTEDLDANPALERLRKAAKR